MSGLLGKVSHTFGFGMGFSRKSRQPNSPLPTPSIVSAPLKISNPVISSPDLNVGSTATAVHGSYTGSISAYNGQWYRGATPIGGATALTYTFVTADIGSNISYQEYASNSGGSSSTGTSNALGPIVAAVVGLTLAQGTITKTSPAGTNPPTWDIASFPDLQDGDTIELYFTTNGATPVVGTPNETHVADAREETITWSSFTGFAPGATVKWGARYGRGGVWSLLSNILSDTMPNTAVATNRGVYMLNTGYGAGPAVMSNVAIAGSSKIVLTVLFSPNGAQSVTSITANSGAITFTRATGLAANGRQQVWYADVGVVTNLVDITINLSGSTQLLQASVDEIVNALAGGPVAVYGTNFNNSGTDPRTVDGGLSAPTGGVGLFGVYCGHNPITFTGATKQAVGVIDPAGQYLAMAYQSVAASVTVSGMTFEGVDLINSTWNHA